MKQAILSIAAIAGLSVAAQAQTLIGFLPEVGLNMASMKTESSLGNQTTDALLGLRAGAMVEMRFSRHFSFEPGVFYSMEGGKSTVLSTVTKTSLSYIQVPLNLKISFPLQGWSRVFAHVGPHVSYAVAGQYKMGSNSTDINFGNGTSQVNPLDIGAHIGAGYDTGFGPYIRLQYAMGFNNLSNVSGVTTTNNSNFSASIGWEF